MKKKYLLIIFTVFAILCMVSCGEKREEEKEEKITLNVVVTKKVYRPECVCDNIEFRNDGSPHYLSQKYYPEEYELYAMDKNGEIRHVVLSSEEFHNLNLKDTLSVSRTITKRKNLLYDTIITNYNCVVSEKFYFPEVIEIDTNKVRTTDGYYRDEIVETFIPEKSFIKGINLSDGKNVKVVVRSYEEVSTIRMGDTVSFYRTEYKERHK